MSIQPTQKSHGGQSLFGQFDFLSGSPNQTPEVCLLWMHYGYAYQIVTVLPLKLPWKQINSLFNQSQEKKKKRKKNALRNLCNKFYLEGDNVEKHEKRISV